MVALYPNDTERFFATRDCDADEVHFAEDLKSFKVDVLINYLPVGSETATRFWASVCLRARVPLVNCIPVFIASDPVWSQRFRDAHVALIGDDMKSQFGASVLSQALQELAEARGHRVKVHIQQNSGGNTDFLNMVNTSRLASKKVSKENVLRDHGIAPDFLHAGPSDYVRIYGDTKVAHFHLELEGFCGSPVKLDARLEVQDSPNSAGVVIDALRYVKLAQDTGRFGALEGPSAFTQKSPPVSMSLADATRACATFH
jgi:myo-inositol-1-phosphate synthase